MSGKLGNVSFFGLLKRKEKEKEESGSQPPVANTDPAENEEISHGEVTQPVATEPLNPGEKTQALYQPTGILDIPLEDADGEETTLRIALFKEGETANTELHEDLREPNVIEQSEEEKTIQVFLGDVLPGEDLEPTKTSERQLSADEQEEAILVKLHDDLMALDDEPLLDRMDNGPVLFDPDVDTLFGENYHYVGLKDTPLESLNPEDSASASHASALADFLERCETPMMISISGDKGSGCSSLMNAVQNKLKDSAGTVELIKFDASELSVFSGGDLAASALLFKLMNFLEAGQEQTASSTEPAPFVNIEGLRNRLNKISPSLAQGAQVPPAELLESVEGLPRMFREAVQAHLQSVRKKRLVIFVDELDSLPAPCAVSFLRTIRTVLNSDGIATAVACRLETVEKGLTDADFGDKLAARDFYNRVFQLSYTLPVGEHFSRTCIEDMFARSAVFYNPEDLGLYKSLLSTSSGLNPRDMKRVFNKMVFVNSLPNPPGLAEDTRNQYNKLLFGMCCLENKFPRVYEEMLREMCISDDHENNLEGLLGLLERQWTAEDGLEDILGKMTPQNPNSFEDEINGFMKPVSFLRALRAPLIFDKRGVLNCEQINNMEAAVIASAAASEERLHRPARDNVISNVTWYCRRVFDALRTMTSDFPEVHNKWAHAENPDRIAYRLWYKSQGRTKAWNSRSLFYKLSYDLKEKNALYFGLYVNTPLILNESVTKEKMDELNKLPILADSEFTLSVSPSTGWLKIEKKHGEIDMENALSAKVEEIYRVAGEFYKLVQATNRCFDVSEQSGISAVADQTKKTGNAVCPKCKRKGTLDIMSRLPDGSIRFQCTACKTKVQGKPRATS